MTIGFSIPDVRTLASSIERADRRALPVSARAAGKLVIETADNLYGIRLQRHTRRRRGGRVAVDAKKGQVWLGMNSMVVSSIRGDARRGRAPTQVQSQREGAVPSSFWFVGRNRSRLRRPLPFRRVGKRIEPVKTPVRSELDRVLRRARTDALKIHRRELVRQYRKGR